ncbi:hypothetical protein EUTSA_v10024244mg [Eutrema salsugineum]|uniref:Uncharacterized protein n=1 Tax=Eutrema salsugineum TaxID=72664 RepID=V4LUE6_EUTSA|nr:uncharacterized protein LOC18031123 isoform X1 [Eutrema salsugineum]XP_024004595.1 uncharacterized protein LOC18031123 isoform X1 [Eutrema salsugineum]ESQ54260.1 hypothetical protein EUTSA_v10024244mg [Eutrema salsugineum]
MSAPGKFDYSSGGPDRSLYRSNLASQMDRSSSFRETMEHPVSSSHPNMLRSTSPLAQTDVTNFFQCLRFDPKVVAADHKSIRQGDFKRHVNIALGIQGDESPSTTLKGKLIPSPIPEEIKRLKAGLRENNVKARERVKIFNEASSVFNKFFPAVPTKKRSRPEGFSNDRSGDRLALGPGLGKMGIQGQTLPGCFELDQQKMDERPKSGALNKRTRTSMMDVRSNAIVRQSAAVDRDKDTVRLANHTAVHGEDRSSIGIDGWEKSKMKKKRSGIKTDGPSSMASNKAVDGFRDLKQGILKSAGDSRSRLNGDSNMLRHGAANGAVPYARSDNLSQQTGLAGRSLLSRDSDHNSLYNEKRERTIASDKDRVNLRAINKSDIQDESNSSSPTSNPKLNVSVRGPRSGSGLPPKLSPVVHNTPSPSDWDIAGCTNKPPLLSGVPNRKRMTSNRSSSPPVTQWASQRPQKISRVARRTNLVPIVSSNDDIPSSDNMSDVGCSETGFGFHRRSPAASPQMKLKGENSLSTTALSGSEEFSPPEIKSKDKGKQSDEVDGKAFQNVPKLSITGLQSRKNKLVSGEELGDGVRRQGRTGRGFGSTRSVNPMGVMKHGTAKQLRSARNSSDKNESRAGRPPTRKLSDRKAYKRQKFTATNATTLDFLVGSDDGHEELLAAVNSAISFAQNFPSSFWKQMERYFCFISDAHINFLKELVEPSPMGTTPVGTSSEFDGREIFPEELTTSRVESKAAPLYQRLLSALISEDSISENEDMQFDGFGADAESEFSVLNQMVEFNGYRSDRLELDELEDDVSVIPFKGEKSLADKVNGRFSDHLSTDFSDIQYETLGIDEKIYLEAQSIGICLEPMPSISNMEDEGIVDEIKTLEEAIREVGSKKKEMLSRLLKPAKEMKELQEKEFDRLGYEKLIEMAYEKSKASRRHHSASGKSSANKISKQAAFAFVKRTLGRCRQFEETGKSCFSESTFKNILVTGLTQIEDNPADKEDILSASTPQPSSSLALRMTQNSDNYANSSENALREGKDETVWSNRMKERELLLDDVGGVPLSSSTKGRRSDRDRDGKGQASSSRGGGTNKIGRPALSNAKGERKSKTKPRHKTTPMFSSSSSVTILEQTRTSLSKPTNSNNSEFSNLGTLDESEPLDLSHLQIPDGLGGPDDFDTQAGDLSSWLNIDDDALQDNDIDLLGLQIPMDDLSDLNMMV